MEQIEVYFSVIGYFPGKPKNIIYRKDYDKCIDAYVHLNKISKIKESLFFVIRLQSKPKNLLLFD